LTGIDFLPVGHARRPVVVIGFDDAGAQVAFDEMNVRWDDFFVNLATSGETESQFHLVLLLTTAF
jgi:hypothetical protein